MKKLNNKGFAVSSLLYGLMLVAFLIVSILMSIMSTNRKNTSTLVKKIEEELNRYSQTATELSSTDGTQEFIVPYGKAGWYKIELWGAAAKDVAENEVNEIEAGRGAYTTGIIYLDENTHLYFQIGSQGGTGGTKNNINNDYGGGATDVRLAGGNWDNLDGKNSRIMVAAGGTHSSIETRRGTGYGYESYYSHKYHNTDYYDGGSFIAGYPGQAPITYTDPITKETKTFSFSSTLMIPAVNAGAGKAKIELISTQGPSDPPAKKTTKLNGVRYIKNCVNFQDSQTKEVWREIVVIGKDPVDGKIKNLAAGKTVKYGKSSNVQTSTNTVNGLTDGSLNKITSSALTASASLKVGTLYDSCIYLDLGTDIDLEEIFIFHSNPDKSGETANYSAEILTVQGTSTPITVLRNSTTKAQTPVETYLGVRFSDRNPEVSVGQVIPGGNYYIQSALADNRFLSTKDGLAKMELYTGDKQQRWSISSVGGIIYKILDGADQMALQPQEGGNEVGENINNATKYGEHAWEQWQIDPVPYQNGYYTLRTTNELGTTLCMSTETLDRNAPQKLQTAICDETKQSQWFKFINADY